MEKRTKRGSSGFRDAELRPRKTMKDPKGMTYGIAGGYRRASKRTVWTRRRAFNSATKGAKGASGRSTMGKSFAMYLGSGTLILKRT